MDVKLRMLGVIAALLAASPVGAMGELFGVALGLKLDNVEGWICQPASRLGDLRTVSCQQPVAMPAQFGEFRPHFALFTEHGEHGICSITGIMYKALNQESGAEPESIIVWSDRVFSDWQALPELGQGKIMSTRSFLGIPDYRVKPGVSTDKVGLKAGGKIMRWENIGPENSALQAEVYDIKPENRPLSEGELFERLTSKGMPVTAKIDMALLTLVGDFDDSCRF